MVCSSASYGNISDAVDGDAYVDVGWKRERATPSSFLHTGPASRACGYLSADAVGDDIWHERHEALGSPVRAESTPVYRTANGLDCR